MRGPLLAAIVCTILCGALPTATKASEPAETAAVPEIIGGIGPGLPERPEREYCTPLGCVGARTAHWSSLAGFAAAALAAAVLARRSRRADQESGSPSRRS